MRETAKIYFFLSLQLQGCRVCLPPADDRWSSSLSTTYLSVHPCLHLLLLVFCRFDLFFSYNVEMRSRSQKIRDDRSDLFIASVFHQSISQPVPLSLLFDSLSQSFCCSAFYSFCFQSVNISARLILSSALPAVSGYLVCFRLQKQAQF